MLSPGFRVAVPATLLFHAGLVGVLALMPEPRPALPSAQSARVEFEITRSGPLSPSAREGSGRGQPLRAAAPAGSFRHRINGRRRTLQGATPAAALSLALPADGARGSEKNVANAIATTAEMLVGAGPSSSPRYRNHPPPIYPRSALRRHREGTPLLLVTIAADGRATAVSLAKSSGYESLDQAALDAVRDWTFEPALVAGRSTTSQALVPVRFSMSDR